MGNLPIILFLLGSVFLVLGWRWQSTPNEEAMTAIKGLAYLKREFLRVQDQVHVLEAKIQTLQQIEHKESALPVLEPKQVEHRELKPKAVEHEVIKQSEIERNEKSKLYSLKTKDQRERIGGDGVEAKRNISPKYQEVIELANKGYCISEIAQHLLLSQDAVMMVLQTQSKGVAR